MNIRNNAAVHYFQQKNCLAVDNFIDEDIARHITDKYVTVAEADKKNKINDKQ